MQNIAVRCGGATPCDFSSANIRANHTMVQNLSCVKPGRWKKSNFTWMGKNSLNEHNYSYSLLLIIGGLHCGKIYFMYIVGRNVWNCPFLILSFRTWCDDRWQLTALQIHEMYCWAGAFSKPNDNLISSRVISNDRGISICQLIAGKSMGNVFDNTREPLREVSFSHVLYDTSCFKYCIDFQWLKFYSSCISVLETKTVW